MPQYSDESFSLRNYILPPGFWYMFDSRHWISAFFFQLAPLREYCVCLMHVSRTTCSIFGAHAETDDTWRIFDQRRARLVSQPRCPGSHLWWSKFHVSDHGTGRLTKSARIEDSLLLPHASGFERTMAAVDGGDTRCRHTGANYRAGV